MTIDFDELAALEAAGALTPEEQQEFDRALAAASPDVRASVAALRNLAVELASIAATGGGPGQAVKDRLLARVAAEPPEPAPFTFRMAEGDDWLPHPIPGIRMKTLAVNHKRGYVTMLLDVAPGVRFPPHHHTGDEECYVISGSVIACGRRLVAGDFHHAEGGSDHGELFTEEGCRVLLVVPPEDYLPPVAG
jgi:quercetin dioxygenase-like cupin family protein